MSVAWNKIRARLLFMGIGLVLGLLVASIVGWGYNTRIEELEGIRLSQIQEKEEKIQFLETKYSRLETEHRKVKSHVQITERTNADGSTERIYDSKRSVESERTVAEQQVTIERLHQQRRIDLLNYEWEKRLIEETKPSAHLSLGIDSRFRRSLHAHYNVYGPFTFGVWGNQDAEYGVSFGISL